MSPVLESAYEILVPKFPLTISGLAGVGKGTVCRQLRGALAIPNRSVGDDFRALAREMRVDPRELEKLALDDLDIDRRVDARTRRFIKNHPKCIIEGRLAGHLVKRNKAAVKVLLTCEDEDRFWRIACRGDNIPFNQAQSETLERERLASNRFQSLYKRSLEQLMEPELYNLCVDTTKLAEDDMALPILEFLEIKGLVASK